MSDPRDRQNELSPQPIPPEPPLEQRKGVSPLVWILLLIALAAAAWWFYNRSVQTGVDTTAPVATAPVITSEQEAAATAERERAAANEQARVERERAAPAVPADREVAVIDQTRPDYPPAAFRAGEEGTVVVRVDVDATGAATNATVETSSRSRELDRAAVEAAKNWRFEPAMRGGKPIASAATVPVEFKLDQQ